MEETYVSGPWPVEGGFVGIQEDAGAFVVDVVRGGETLQARYEARAQAEALVAVLRGASLTPTELWTEFEAMAEHARRTVVVPSIGAAVCTVKDNRHRTAVLFSQLRDELVADESWAPAEFVDGMPSVFETPVQARAFVSSLRHVDGWYSFVRDYRALVEHARRSI